MKKIVLVNGRIYDFGQRVDEVGDLTLESGVISQVGVKHELPDAIKPGADWSEHDAGDALFLNCEGMIVSPGFVDLHVHLREPGGEAKETIETGTAAAAAGGFTTVVAMPNTNPPISDKVTVGYVQERADECGSCRVMPAGALSAARAGAEPAQYAGMIARGISMFTDDGCDIADAAVFARAMCALSAYPATVAIHAEDAALSAGGVMHDGAVASRLGHLGIPPISETVSVARAILLSEYYGTPLHVCHVSAAGTVELLRMAKAKYLKVTAEVTPHHLLLTEDAVAEHGSIAKCNPPLRSEEDRKALVAALADGTIDAIATDHAPHTRDEKEQVMELAPFGIAGLETCAGLIWKHLVLANKLPMQRFFDALVTRTAHILSANQVPREAKTLPELTAHGRRFWALVDAGLGTLKQGAPADITVFDPRAEWKVEPAKFHSKCKFSPFAGWDAQGHAAWTIVGGEMKSKAPQ